MVAPPVLGRHGRRGVTVRRYFRRDGTLLGELDNIGTALANKLARGLPPQGCWQQAYRIAIEPLQRTIE